GPTRRGRPVGGQGRPSDRSRPQPPRPTRPFRLLIRAWGAGPIMSRPFFSVGPEGSLVGHRSADRCLRSGPAAEAGVRAARTEGPGAPSPAGGRGGGASRPGAEGRGPAPGRGAAPGVRGAGEAGSGHLVVKEPLASCGELHVVISA